MLIFTEINAISHSYCNQWFQSVYFRRIYTSSIMTHDIQVARQCCRLLHRISDLMQLCGDTNTGFSIWPGFQLPGGIELIESQCLKKGLFHTEEDLLKGYRLKMSQCYILSYMLYETEIQGMPFLTERWWALSYSPGPKWIYWLKLYFTWFRVKM